MSRCETVKRIGKFLGTIAPEVEEVYLMGGEIAVIRFINGYEKAVNIACDSDLAMVMDITRAVMY